VKDIELPLPDIQGVLKKTAADLKRTTAVMGRQGVQAIEKGKQMKKTVMKAGRNSVSHSRAKLR